MRITTLKDIKPIITALDRIGLSSELYQRKDIFSHPIRYCIFIISVVIWVIGLVTYTFESLNDFDKLVAAMAVLIQFLLTLTKHLVYVARRKRFLRLNEALERLAWKGNKAEREIWNAKNCSVLSIVRAYCIICHLCAIISLMLPMLKLLYYYIWCNEVVLTLHLPASFPYDTTQPFFYIFIYILSWLLVYFNVYTVAVVEGLFGWFVFNISAHLQIMRLKLEQLLELPNDGPEFQSHFAAFITYHKQIISLTYELDAVYAPIIFILGTSSCLPICFITFQLSYMNDPASAPFNSLLLSTILMQLIIYCFGGEKLQNECDELNENIYLLIQWQNLPARHCRLYLMPLMRSQKVLVLTGYFFNADRRLLVWIFRTAGSVTAVLLALKQKQE